MTTRPIIRFPDPRLRLPAAPVSTFDAALCLLCDDLIETMRAAPGIGITAPHIGVAARVTVIELEGEHVRKYVNPKIVWSSPDLITHPEGSVSMPGVSEDVIRPRAVRVSYQ